MSINRDEALRAKDMAEGLMIKTDYTAARKLAIKAQKMDSTLENISRMVMVCDVHCAATEKLFGNELDWYGILQVEQNADDVVIKKQYRKLALLLHPDKNKLPGAEAAFKLIGEAQRILLDKEKRMLHDTKLKSWRKPAPARSYKKQPMPGYRTQPVSGANVNQRNVFNELRPENMYTQQQRAQAHRATFWTICPFCRLRYQFLREHLMKEITCQSRNCMKKFTALEAPFQNLPPENTSFHTTFPFPQQNKFPAQKAANEPPKRPDIPAFVPSKKASVPKPGSTAETSNITKKRKNMVESSESSDSDSSSESEDDVSDATKAARDSGSSGGQQPWRSVRTRRQVSYNENLNDDDDEDIVDDNVEASPKNVDTEREEEPEDEDHHSSEALPNGINPKEKVKEEKVRSSGGASDSEEEPNIISCDDPEFSDFDKLREKDCFKAGQIWALYDDGEGMPRFYAVIKTVSASPNFLLKYVWLEAEEDEENETRNLPVSVGKYELGTGEKTDQCSVFSHLVHAKIKSGARHFKIFPKKGETWALFKNWNVDLPSDSDSPCEYEYEFVEILSDHAEGTAISVGFLSKVEGFICVFRPMPSDGSNTCEIPPQEFCRFSHSVPSSRLTGTEGRGVIKGWLELDPAALPISKKPPGEEASKDQDHQSQPSGSAF